MALWHDLSKTFECEREPKDKYTCIQSWLKQNTFPLYERELIMIELEDILLVYEEKLKIFDV